MRRSALCGTFPRLAPAGRYPAPYVHGARTFLPGHLSVIAGAAVQPTDTAVNGPPGRPRQGLGRDPTRGARSILRPFAVRVHQLSAESLLLACIEASVEWLGSIGELLLVFGALAE